MLLTRGIGMKTSAQRVFALVLLGAFANTALADVPFFWAAASLKVIAWWTIPITLLVEGIVLRFLFEMSWIRAAKASIVINAVSGLAGMILYLPLGFILYPILAPVTIPFTSLMTREAGNAVELVLTLAVMALVDTFLELLTLKMGFAVRLSQGRVLAFLLTNVATMAMIFYAILSGTVTL